MSESATIIFDALRSFDCAIPQDTVNFDGFGPESTVAVVAQCLNLIDKESPPLKLLLPKNLASRHKSCAELGKRLKDAGYPGECGYNQFLYPNWRDVKDIFTYLVGSVPRGDADEDSGAVGGSSTALLQHSIQTTLKSWRKDTWVPPFCNATRGFGHHFRTDPIEFCRSEAIFSVPSVDRQVRKSTVDAGPSLLQHNALLLARQRDEENLDNTEESRRAKSRLLASLVRRAFDSVDPNALAAASGSGGGSSSTNSLSMSELLEEMMAGAGDENSTAFQNATEFAQEKVAATAEAAAIAAEAEADKEEEAKKKRLKRESDLNEMEERMRTIMSDINILNKTKESNIAKSKALGNQVQTQLRLKKELEAEYKLKKKTLDLLPNAEANIEKLKSICDESGSRLLELATEWEKHRVPLIEAIRDIKQGMGRRKGECKWKVGEIKRMRDEMRSMAVSIREAEERHKLLLVELEKMPKNINRAVYTYRILDIIKQIGKQKIEIGRIIDDIRQVQKETNAVAQTLQRQENVTDDHVYKAAKDNQVATNGTSAYVQSYKLLTKVRERFDDMVSSEFFFLLFLLLFFYLVLLSCCLFQIFFISSETSCLFFCSTLFSFFFSSFIFLSFFFDFLFSLCSYGGGWKIGRNHP